MIVGSMIKLCQLSAKIKKFYFRYFRFIINMLRLFKKKWYDIFKGDSNEVIEENSQENKNNIRENSLDRLNEELDNSWGYGYGAK